MHMIRHDDMDVDGGFRKSGGRAEPLLIRDLSGAAEMHAAVDHLTKIVVPISGADRDDGKPGLRIVVRVQSHALASWEGDRTETLAHAQG